MKSEYQYMFIDIFILIFGVFSDVLLYEQAAGSNERHIKKPGGRRVGFGLYYSGITFFAASRSFSMNNLSSRVMW